MKKKTYIKPEIVIVEIDQENIMAASGENFGETSGLPEIDDPNNVFSKFHNVDVWGFDEDED
ncbi:MAG: hypothetical protein K2G86_02780 [Prevotella sp.]|nr:hypothetical protein [Prevotella sp.]MDE6354654.1 hypothetical protein [Prevotella sp.]